MDFVKIGVFDPPKNNRKINFKKLLCQVVMSKLSRTQIFKVISLFNYIRSKCLKYRIFFFQNLTDVDFFTRLCAKHPTACQTLSVKIQCIHILAGHYYYHLGDAIRYITNDGYNFVPSVAEWLKVPDFDDCPVHVVRTWIEPRRGWPHSAPTRNGVRACGRGRTITWPHGVSERRVPCSV